MLDGITHVAGNSFSAALPHDAWSSHRRASTARVYESGKSLAWGNSLHDAIRDQGRGRYSFWHGVVYFSASDDSDPRHNGRKYIAKGPRPIPDALYRGLTVVTLGSAILLWLCLAAKRRSAAGAAAWDGVSFVLGPRVAAVLSTETGLRRWSSIAVTTLTLALALPLIAASLGFFPSIRLSDGGPKDSRLIASILLHAMLGLVLTFAQAVVGSGLCLVVMRRRSITVGRLLLFGYPLSLAWAAGCAAAAITLPGGSTIATVLLLCSVVPLFWWHPDRRGLALAGRVLVLTLPFAAAFAILLGALWHGPTDTLPASVMGDHVFYSANTSAYALGLWPIAHLGVAGERQSYFATMPSLVGAALRHMGGFDPFLFFATSIPLFGALLTMLGFAFLPHVIQTVGGSESSSRFRAIGCGLLVAGASQFPSWLVSSPPVALSLPLVPSVYALSRSDRFRGRLAALLTAALGTALTKLTVAPTLVVLTLSRLVITVQWRRERWRGVAILMFALLAGLVALALLLRYVPSFAAIANSGPRSWQDWSSTSPWLWRDAGLLLLGFTMLGAWQRTTGVSVMFGIVICWLSPFVFEAAGLCAVVLAACVLATQEAKPRSVRLATAAGGLLCAGSIALEPAGRVPALALVFLVMMACGLAVHRASPFGPGMLQVTLPAYGLVLSASVTLALANGALILNSGHRPEELTPAARDIWRAARERTAPRALVFTDQTGSDSGLLGGWNTYCFLGERQVFVASVLQSGLRFDAAAQRLRLLQNDNVLRGVIGPADLPEAAGYAGWYAVVSNSRAMPGSFRLCYRNESYSLYARRGTRAVDADGGCRE